MLRIMTLGAESKDLPYCLLVFVKSAAATGAGTAEEGDL